MTTAVALVVLAVLDAAFAGFRASAGRDGHLAKRGYYAAAMAYGTIAGLVITAFVAVWIAECLGIANHPVMRFHDYVDAGNRMLCVFAPYAALVLAALLGWLLLPFEPANLMTLLVLGPFTFARPFVIALGVIVAAAPSGDGTVAVSCVLAGGAALVVGPLVGLLYRTG